LGHAFHEFGAQTRTLYTAPTAENLAHADIYIIMDPNFETTPKNPHYNPHPNYMTPEDGKVIADWVKRGGVLLLFANDKLNSEFDYYNTLAERFGITFHKDIRNFVPNDKFEMGALTFDSSQSVFQKNRKIYMKEICTLGIRPPARALLTDKGDTIMAVSHVGEGMVFAVGDPWLYNEYTDGRKLPSEFQNYQAAQDLVRWSLTRTSQTHRN
jgi:unsaturated rhamnogalacturonyl hydrolase